MTDLSGLFEPMTIGDLTLKNRIVMPAMGLAAGEDGAPNDDHAAYYARRAQGGAGAAVRSGRVRSGRRRPCDHRRARLGGDRAARREV